MGFSQEALVEYCVRRTRGWMIAGGSIEVLKNRIAEGERAARSRNVLPSNKRRHRITRRQTMQRRTWVAAAAAMAGLALSSTALASDAYPAKPVKIIVGFQAGGPTDVVARLVAKALQDELKGAFIVENKVGATSNIASEMVAARPMATPCCWRPHR
jgi:hypothetical protein